MTDKVKVTADWKLAGGAGLVWGLGGQWLSTDGLNKLVDCTLSLLDGPQPVAVVMLKQCGSVKKVVAKTRSYKGENQKGK